MDKLGRFSAVFYKGDKLSYFLLASLHTKSLLKGKNLLFQSPELISFQKGINGHRKATRK